MTVALYHSLKSGRLIPPAPFFLLKISLAILCFHTDCEFFFFVLVLCTDTENRIVVAKVVGMKAWLCEVSKASYSI